MIVVLWLQKHSRTLLPVLLVLLGLSLGQMTAALLQIRLDRPSAVPDTAPAARQEAPALPSLKDFSVIVQRNIFNAQTGSLGQFEAADSGREQPPAARSSAQFKLLGTVAGAQTRLAVIQVNREIDTYRLDEILPGNVKLVAVRRNQVDLEHPDGSRETLLTEPSATAATPERGSRSASAAQAAVAATASGIRSIGDNRWEIPLPEAEKARQNINELLRQARVEPNIVNGETAGFTISMIRPGSLFAMLGLRVGDVLREVNGVSLDSPEKALQIFQQLREARQISISLERDGQPTTFGYEIN